MSNAPRLSALVLGLLILAACASAVTAAVPVPPAAPSQAAADQGAGQGPASAAPVVVPAAQTYYVAEGGNDGSDGSSGTPWATLQHAVDGIAPGDTIMVRSGEYEGCRIEQSGTAGAWMTLQAEPGATVRITAPGPNNRHDSNIEVETWEGDGTVAYWVIQGLEVSGAPNWGIDVRGGEEAHTHHVTVRYTVCTTTAWPRRAPASSWPLSTTRSSSTTRATPTGSTASTAATAATARWCAATCCTTTPAAECT